MRAADLARSALDMVDADDNLVVAAREMEDNGVTCLVVCEDGRLVGILTASDIIRAAAEVAPFAQTPVEEYMTADPPTIPADADPARALSILLDAGADALPVVDAEGDPIAIVCLRDVIPVRA